MGHEEKKQACDFAACPPGTYKPVAIPGGVGTCLPCPDPRHTSRPGSTSVSDCVCNEGYTLHNHTCQAVVCPVLSAPENGFFIQNMCNNQFNSACGVRCLAGFELQGSSIRLCQADGTWSGAPSICTARSCPVLSTPQHGQLNCSTGVSSSQLECAVRCQKGFRLEGKARLTCLPSSQWSGPPPRCVEARCSSIVTLEQVRLSPPACGKRAMRTGAVCRFSCRQGYRLLGNPEVRCLATGEWSNDMHKVSCAGGLFLLL
ncbi:sushi, von Willebrand factor type A, EGF and pentraxin domain-containing protein 1 isoform X2 [Tachysurus ichikawai]